MSSLSPQPAPVPPELASHHLAALRAELDRIDDTLHDGLMRRAEIVAQVGALGAKGRVPLRPGREASIIRRLLARNRGALQPAALVRVWREMLAGSTAQQQPIRVVVGGDALVAPAQEHFGALTPVHVGGSSEEALAEVRLGATTIAVLRWPEERESWWTAMLDGEAPVVHVVARLPFWARSSSLVEGVVLSTAAPDPSGDDRSLIGCELPADSALFGRALAYAGFVDSKLIVERTPDGRFALADVAGFVAADDPRLTGLPGRSVVLGAYAVPVGEPA